MIEPSFIRYLAAKRTVDDRALNRNVWNTLSAALPPTTPERPLRVIEVGAGIGTMLERMVARRLLKRAVYTALDAEATNMGEAARLLPLWAGEMGYTVLASSAGRARLTRAEEDANILVELETIDVFDFVARESGHQSWDLLIAHDFLYLLDIPSALPRLLSLLGPGGLCYLTANFDGAALLQPEIDAAFDAEIERLWRQTTNARIAAGKPSGDQQTGRHLFGLLKAAGVDILDAGSSDWVVFAGRDGYPVDEAYFLHVIVETMREALIDHPALAGRREQFTAWIEQRHRQITHNELVCIAHQLDFVGVVRG